MARFDKTYCSQCGTCLGPGNEGVSSCCDHGCCPVEARGDKCECDRTRPSSRLAELRRLIADDSHAITFQSFGQYRTALLKAIDNINTAGVSVQEQCARLCESLKHDPKEVPPSSHDYDTWDDAVTACAEAIRAHVSGVPPSEVSSTKGGSDGS